MTALRLIPAIALAAVAVPALAAGPVQNVAVIDRAVAGFTGRAIGDEGGARAGVDTRLKLAACATLTLAWRTDAHDAVVVRCTDPEWRVYVPVRMPSTTVAAAPVAAIAPVPVRAAPVIKRGDPVVIEAGADGFSITREGVALADAAPGARFMVRVDNAKNPVQAVAIESGRATLPGWGE